MIEFYDSITGYDLSSGDYELKKIDLIRNHFSRYIKKYKEIMTNTLRRHGVLIGEIRTRIEVYEIILK